MCRAALSLVELRRRGVEKFSSAQEMFFDREGLEMAQQCGIKTIPTMIIYKGEEECERMVGLPEKKDLEESLKLYLD